MPVPLIPDAAMPVGEETPAREKTQELEVVHLALQKRAHLARTGMPGQPTDISVGMAMTTTMPTEAVPVITGQMCLHVPVLWRGDSGHASLRQMMRATTSTGSMIKMSWICKVRQDRHVLVHGS